MFHPISHQLRLTSLDPRRPSGRSPKQPYSPLDLRDLFACFEHSFKRTFIAICNRMVAAYEITRAQIPLDSGMVTRLFLLG